MGLLRQDLQPGTTYGPENGLSLLSPRVISVMLTSRNIKDLSDAVTEQRKNFVVDEVNDSCLRLAVNHEEYPWHFHSNSDELFVVLEGELTVEFRDRDSVTLRPNDSLLVPAGVVHKTCPRGRTVNLCFERTDAETQFVEE